jgi:hypothetical protein
VQQPKRDFLAAGEHAKRWANGSATPTGLSPTRSRRSRSASVGKIALPALSVASAIYERLPDDVRLWRLGRDFSTVLAERPMLTAAFGLSASEEAR